MSASNASSPTKWQVPFFTIWTGQAFSLLGSQLVGFALVWWLTASTGSATILATATLVAMLPGIVLGPIVGALVDRWNRRIVMMVADSGVALITIGLIVIAWIGILQPWHVYVAMFLRSVGGTFHWPAMRASTSLMVPKKHLSRVAGLNQTLEGAMSIVAPPLGALLITVWPLHGVLAVDVVTALLAVLPLTFTAVPQPERSATISTGSGIRAVLADVREGLHYIWTWPGLLALLIMAAMLNLLINPAFALLPLLVTRHLGGAALELGWLSSAWGLGIVLGGLGLSVWGGFRRRIYTSLMGLVGLGIGIALVGLAPVGALWWALAGTALAGIMNSITNGPLFAVLQDVVAPDMQGRVFTVVGSLSQLVVPLGLAVAGPVGDALGVQSWFLVAGIACIVMAAAGAGSRAIRHLEDHRPAVGASPVEESVVEATPAELP